MEKDRKFRALAIAAICVAIVGVSIAYAALTTTLTITGTATVSTDNAWDIRFTDVKGISKSTAVTSVVDPSYGDTPNMTWAATFGAPQTTYSFTATIKNNGTIPAKLNFADGLSSFITATGEAASNFTYTVTLDGASIDTYNGYVWAAKSQKDIVVTVTLDPTGALDENALEALNTKGAVFTLGLPFVQATDSDVTTATGSNKIFTAVA